MDAPQINRERVWLLVDALRSGGYEQCFGSLMREKDGVKSYCCLGVATHVALLNGLDGDVTTVEDYRLRGYTAMPDEVRRWYGFGASDPFFVTASDERSSAMYLNDFERLSFAEIADAFERTFLAGKVAEDAG